MENTKVDHGVPDFDGSVNKPNHHAFSLFPVGTPVRIACKCQDFSFFFGETGRVIENKYCYLGIIVEYVDKDGDLRTFNFNPSDLEIIGQLPKLRCRKCGRDLTGKGAFTYLSGDRWDCHLEERPDGSIVIVNDEDYECDSITACSTCGEPVSYDDQEVYR